MREGGAGEGGVVVGRESFEVGVGEGGDGDWAVGIGGGEGLEGEGAEDVHYCGVVADAVWAVNASMI